MTTTPTSRPAKLTERVAEEIRAAMGRRRITGAELARRLHVSQMWVSYRLNGRQPIDLNDLEAIAEAIGVTVHDLVPRLGGGDTSPRYLPWRQLISLRSPDHPAEYRRPASRARIARQGALLAA